MTVNTYICQTARPCIRELTTTKYMYHSYQWVTSVETLDSKILIFEDLGNISPLSQNNIDFSIS